MKNLNLWKSLFVASGSRSRRRTRSCFDSCAAAEVLEVRQLLSAAAPQMSLTLLNNSLTLTSTDIYNPTVTVHRSGNLVVFAGSNGTQIKYTNNGSIGTTQSIPVASVNNLTVNLGTGSDTITIYGLSVSGNISITGQASGIANVQIYAGPPSVTIGGSILANFGGEAATFGVFGSFNGGGNLTVNGSINVTEGGSGTQQVNIYGPPADNPSGGKLAIVGGVSVVDNGTGRSGLRIDDGVTIGGNVSFNNAANTVNGDDVQIYSNSVAYGVTSIAGNLSLSLSNAVYSGDYVKVSGNGSQLPVTGQTSITTGNGSDQIWLLNDWFKNTVTVNTGGSPSFGFDQTIIQGSRFDGAVTVTMTGPHAQLGIGTVSTYVPTVFNSTFTANMTGPGAAVYWSNPVSTVNEVVFNSTALLQGGTPVGTLFIQGRYFVGAGKLTRHNFVVVFV